MQRHSKAAPASRRVNNREDTVSKIVQFPGEFITEEDRERDRWVTVAFCATAVAGQPKDNQIAFLQATLAKFADVPDQRPPLDDRQYPAYAVKLLLRGLTDESGVMAQASEKAFDAVFGEFFSDGT
jgi:hypothetical protein